MKRMRLLIGLVLLALTLAACEQGGGYLTPTPGGVGTTIDPDTIVFETSGTIAGIREVLTIQKSREATFTDRTNSKAGTVDESAYKGVLDQLGKADFMNLKERYDSGTVSDDRYYSITITQGTQTKSVTVAEQGGKDITPAALTELIARLQEVEKGLE